MYNLPPTLSGSIADRDILLRLDDIIGPNGYLPVSKSTIWSWVRSGKLAKPIRLSGRVSAWRKTDILALVRKAQEGQLDE